MKYQHNNHNVCSSKVTFDLTDGVVRDVVFTGGCNGNLKAIAKLVEGMRADDVVRILAGNTCGGNDTSCADQLARGIAAAQKKAAQ